MSVFRLRLTLAFVPLAAALVLAFQWWKGDNASRAESRRRLASVLSPDVVPRERLRISGNVKVVGIVGLPEAGGAVGNRMAGEARQGCDALCAALLANPAVTSVTVVPTAEDGEHELQGRATRFRLEPRTYCHGETVQPQSPDGITPRITRTGSLTITTFDDTLAKAWSRRLSTVDCIVAETPAGPYDLTIAYSRFTRFGPRTEAQDWHWSREPLSVQGTKLVVTGRTGRVLLRQTIAWTKMIDRPRLPGMVGVAGYATPVIGWVRTVISNGTLIHGTKLVQDLDAPRALLSYTDVNPRDVIAKDAAHR